MRQLAAIVAGCAMLSVASAQDPFPVTARLSGPPGSPLLGVSFTVPAKHYLYANRLAVKASGNITLTPRDQPPAKSKHDPFSEEEVQIYDHDVTFTYSVSGDIPAEGLSVDVSYQGCNASMCFLPQRRTLRVPGAGTVASAAPESPTPRQGPRASDGPGNPLLKDFRVVGRATGYMPPRDFAAFLQRAARAEGTEQDRLVETFEKRSAWLAILVILLGGLALNLTPCVLPMIPINLAIIGAGVQSGSRWRGFALGAAYGVGIAIVYGALGLVVILTGAKFGTLNSSPWFNLSIAAVFLVMALAMFDVLHVDFSRFQVGPSSGGGRKGGLAAALLMGGIAALLAGACVAPVLISVLLLSANLYATGHPAGLLLPFVLGVGMALPWPFAGAGIALLPKPGRWMDRVKIGFGVLILAASLWYGHLGFSLWRDRLPAGREAVALAQEKAVSEGWMTSLDEAFALSRSGGQPVFIDFWASWCKNCLKMDRTTFSDPEVRRAFDGFLRVKYRAEDLSAPEIKAFLDQFQIVGLPTYLVLRPLRSTAGAGP